MSAGDVASSLAAVRAEIAAACRRAGRDPRQVVLVGVTKGQDAEAVRAAVAAGLRDLGENFVQELERKRAHAPEVRWHFLGTVQSNKARRVAAVSAVVHGLEPGRGARKLGAAAGDAAVRCLLEVDFTGRRQGVAPEDVGGAVRELRATPGLRLVGLMTVPPPAPDAAAARPYFRELRRLRDAHGADLPELSMGMSADFPVAVEEGATMVRVGTAIFGSRPG